MDKLPGKDQASGSKEALQGPARDPLRAPRPGPLGLEKLRLTALPSLAPVELGGSPLSAGACRHPSG